MRKSIQAMPRLGLIVLRLRSQFGAVRCLTKRLMRTTSREQAVDIWSKTLLQPDAKFCTYLRGQVYKYIICIILEWQLSCIRSVQDCSLSHLSAISLGNKLTEYRIAILSLGLSPGALNEWRSEGSFRTEKRIGRLLPTGRSYTLCTTLLDGCRGSQVRCKHIKALMLQRWRTLRGGRCTRATSTRRRWQRCCRPRVLRCFCPSMTPCVDGTTGRN